MTYEEFVLTVPLGAPVRLSLRGLSHNIQPRDGTNRGVYVGLAKKDSDPECIRVQLDGRLCRVGIYHHSFWEPDDNHISQAGNLAGTFPSSHTHSGSTNPKRSSSTASGVSQTEGTR